MFGDFMREGFTAIIEFFKRAAVVVGVHGAGLANIMFAAQCKLLPSSKQRRTIRKRSLIVLYLQVRLHVCIRETANASTYTHSPLLPPPRRYDGNRANVARELFEHPNGLLCALCGAEAGLLDGPKPRLVDMVREKEEERAMTCGCNSPPFDSPRVSYTYHLLALF